MASKRKPVIAKASDKAVKTNKKSSAKKFSVKSARTKISESQSVDLLPSETTLATRPPFKRSYIIAIIAAVILLVILYSAKSFFVAAVVNGQPISRLNVIHSLEQQGGKQALDSLITDTVIKQEASKRHITITQQDIDSQMKGIESNLAKQGQTLDAALAAQGMTRSDLTQRIMIQSYVQKMVGPVSVSDKEISDYMTQNKDSLPPGSDANSVKQQLMQQKLQQKEQTFVQDLTSKAKVTRWVNY